MASSDDYVTRETSLVFISHRTLTDTCAAALSQLYIVYIYTLDPASRPVAAMAENACVQMFLNPRYHCVF